MSITGSSERESLCGEGKTEERVEGESAEKLLSDGPVQCLRDWGRGEW